MFLAAWKLEMCAVRRMGARKYEEALECYGKMMEKVKPSAHHWEMIAQCYEWLGETEKADRAARSALEGDEESFDALRLLARLGIAQGDYAQAREYVRKALVVQRGPLSGRPGFPLRLMRLLGRILGRRQVAEDTYTFSKGPEPDDEQWYGWAREFLSGYERAFGDKSHARPR